MNCLICDSSLNAKCKFHRRECELERYTHAPLSLSEPEFTEFTGFSEYSGNTDNFENSGSDKRQWKAHSLVFYVRKFYIIYEHKNKTGGFALTQEDKVLLLLDAHSGYLTAKTAQENGIYNATLLRMAERGIIDRAARGLYVGADIIPDPFFITQYRCPKGVFSHETALFLHDFSDRTPLRMMMTIPSGWNTKLLSSGDLNFFYCMQKNIRLGTVKKTTPYNLEVIVYDAERTICDCLRSIDKLDRDLVLTALKRYLKKPGSDRAKLLEYAAIFKIRNTVLTYMEVL